MCFQLVIVSTATRSYTLQIYRDLDFSALHRTCRRQAVVSIKTQRRFCFLCIFNKAWEWLVTCTSTILDIKTVIEHFETITRKHTRPKAVYVTAIKRAFNV